MGTLTFTGSNNFSGGAIAMGIGAGGIMLATSNNTPVPNAAGSIVVGGSAGYVGSASSLTVYNNGLLTWDNSTNVVNNRFGGLDLLLLGGTFCYEGGIGSAAVVTGTLKLGANTNSFLTTVAAPSGNSMLTLQAIGTPGAHTTFNANLDGATAATGRVLLTNTTSLTLVNGIVPWAAETNAGGFLTYDPATGYLGAYGSITGTNFTSLDSATATSNVKLTSADSLTSTGVINSLQIAPGGGSVNLNGNTLTIASGGLFLNSAGATVSGGVLTAGSGNELFFLTNNTASVSGTITDNGSPVALTKGLSSSLTLSGSNSYTGPTTVNAGSLVVAAGGAIAPSSSVTVNSGGSMNVNTGGYVGGNISVARATGGNSTPNFVNSGTIAGSLTIAAPLSGQTWSLNNDALAGYAQLAAGSTTGPVTVNGRLDILGGLNGIGTISGNGTTGAIYYDSTAANTLNFQGGSAIQMFIFGADNIRATLTQSGGGGVYFQSWACNAYTPNADVTLSGGAWTLSQIGRNNFGFQMTGTTHVTNGATVTAASAGWVNGSWDVNNGSLSLASFIAEASPSTPYASLVLSASNGGAISVGSLVLADGGGSSNANALNVGANGAFTSTGNLTLGSTTLYTNETDTVNLSGGNPNPDASFLGGLARVLSAKNRAVLAHQRSSVK